MGWSGKRGGNPTGTDTLWCFEASTGKQLWKQSYRCRYQGRVRTGDTGGYGGPSSTPTFDKATGRLYTLSVDGDFRCWDTRRRGRLLWARNFYDVYKVRRRPNSGEGVRDYGFTSAPLLSGGDVIVEVGAGAGTLMAFDKTTGKRRWASAWKRPAGHTSGPVHITVNNVPCIVTLTLFDLLVARIDKGHEGRTVATVPWRTEYACNVATPAAVGNRIAVTSGYNHKHTALFEITLSGARRRWVSKSYALMSSPTIWRDRVFVIDRRLKCVGLADGRERWSGGDFGHGSCLVTGDGKLLVFGKGSLSLVEAAPKTRRYRELARVKRLVRGTCYPHVALSDGIIACKDRDGNLVCLSVRPRKRPK